jgi:hypothetical protein
MTLEFALISHAIPDQLGAMICEYAFLAINNLNLKKATRYWFTDQNTAIMKYGFIGDWDTSQVTNV